MFEKPHGKAQRVRQVLDSLPDDAGVFRASELGNGETRPVPLEYDDRGQALLPMMQGEPVRELPSLSATAEGW